ncbi:hypothetical protein [Flavobacterium sp. H4147]|uniref:hypothetical protein n=1 Tax=Flavobacterium sp. H4147 TaxID=3034149 RepID=UPI0023EBE184|nr:hypothetical protein [Flavobacterium sp. H4147]
MATRSKLEVSLLKLTTEQFFCSENLFSEFNKTEGAMNNTIQLGVDASKSILGCLFKFEIKKDSNELLVIEAGAHFKADEEGFKKLLNKKKKTFTLPFATARLMLVVAIGVARGILHAKTEGTDINGIFIPLIDPDSVLDKDIIIDLSPEENL